MRLWALILWLLAAPAWALQPFDAEYRLLFNDELVARAFFRLQLQDGDRYVLEAYTVPDGKMAEQRREHEILEASEGSHRGGSPVPENYFYSVRDPEGTRLFEQVFDWAQDTLHLHSGEATEAVELEDGTQDRLSYLLQLARAVADGKDDLAFAVAEPERTQSMRFRQHAREPLTLPAGQVEAVGVDCYTTGDTPDRVIWIAPAWDHIPVLIERAVPDGRVRMELVLHDSGPLPAP